MSFFTSRLPASPANDDFGAEAARICSLLKAMSRSLQELPSLDWESDIDIHLCARLLGETAGRHCRKSRS